MFSSKPWNLFKMSHFYMAAVIIQRCESCLFPPLLVGRSWNKWLPIMGEFRFNFQKRGKALLETPKDRKQKKTKNKDSEREKERNVKCEGERWGGEGDGVKCWIIWVCFSRGGSRSEWLGAAGGDVEISSSLVVTLSSTTCFLSFSFHSLPPSSSIVSFMTPPPPPPPPSSPS